MRLGGSYALLPRELALHAGGFYESRGVQPAFADVDTFAFARVGLGLGVVYRFGRWDLRAGYAHIFSETMDVAPPPHQNVEAADPVIRGAASISGSAGTFGDDGTRQRRRRPRRSQTLPRPAAPTRSRPRRKSRGWPRRPDPSGSRTPASTRRASTSSRSAPSITSEQFGGRRDRNAPRAGMPRAPRRSSRCPGDRRCSAERSPERCSAPHCTPRLVCFMLKGRLRLPGGFS